ALKFISLEGAAHRFEVRALELMKQLRHPHLLTVSGHWQTRNLLIIAVDLADGTLRDRCDVCLREGLPGIPGPELLEYMRERAKGIDSLTEPRHTLDGKTGVGFQHRDIKPANLLLVGGSVKVGDFGLVKLLENTTTSNSGALTVAYAAPEFFKARTNKSSDQYALAITYCELRGGRLPFQGSPEQIMAGHLGQPPDLTMLPEAERQVVVRALSKDPEERWPSCRAFVEALSGQASGLAGATTEVTTGSAEPSTAQVPANAAKADAP